ncbi:IPTL-CTERM sorting domain-containing protein [Acidovorax sp. ACV01]|uniref:IPTL-CTERM sorting domain-containing protein n=1 Tax=Acidovorax sp. ACV01 TaxID=2769311 RepID=UPI001781C77A|nr:IPTL-CTERM sorting domain-containing protein [Acidovorax sp. ACV01]MBD9390785.1 IPTL-CTERM sorting domain-containing protein [Acidovorax sp. ACV01]
MRYLLKQFVRVSVTALAMVTLHVHAATLTVLNTSDAGAGSLRDRISAAAPGDTIVFGPGVAGTIPLASTLSVAQNLTIRGPGAGSLTINGQNTVRVFSVTGGALTLSAVTISNGFTTGLGGGLDVLATATLTLSNSVLSNNAAANGGAISIANGGTLTVTNSTFANNSTTSVGGGGLINFGNSTVIGNTFVGNNAPINGGAINNQPSGVLAVINNTLRTNTSNGLGGAMANLGTTTAVNNTFSGNQGSSGAAMATGNSNVTLHNNIFADHVAGAAPAALNPGGGFTTSSNNVFYNNLAAGVADDQTGYGTVNFVWTSTQPLGPLANNGGPTQTMHPVQNGAAMCAGSIALLPGGIATDQRGSPRTSGGCIDAGSVQHHAIPTLSTWALILLVSLMAMLGIRRPKFAKF